MANDLILIAPGSAGVSPANVSVAAQGYLWGGTVFDTRNAGTNTAWVAAANQVRAMQFVLPFSITIRQASWYVSSAPGDSIGCGIYSADGTTKLVDTGAVVTAGTGVVQSITFTGVVVSPGVYYFAWTQTGTPSAQLGVIPAVTTPGNAVLNVNATKRFVTAGNAATAGALPASLGTLTTPVNGVLPVVLFES